MTFAQYLRLGLHVSASSRDVIRAAHRLLPPRGRSRCMRGTRHAWLRSMLREHELAGHVADYYTGRGSRGQPQSMPRS